jgi:hypothetical protein
MRNGTGRGWMAMFVLSVLTSTGLASATPASASQPANESIETPAHPPSALARFKLDPSWLGRSAASSASFGWKIQASPNPLLPNGSFFGVSCTSSASCVGVGAYTGTSVTQQPLTEVLSGETWRIERPKVPKSTINAAFNGVSCTAADSCTAVGDYVDASGIPNALAESWDGTAWTPESAPTLSGAVLTSVSCMSANRCEAVGLLSSAFATAPLAAQWNGLTWTLQVVPDPDGAPATLNSISCAGADSCEAVGDSVFGTLAVGWNGRTWRFQDTPNPNQSAMYGVTCTGSNACLGVGTYVNSAGTQLSLAEVWDGASWQTVPAVQPKGALASLMSSVSCAGFRCYASGFYLNGTQMQLGFVAQWNGSSWTLESTKAPRTAVAVSLYGISCPAVNDCEAAGGYVNPSQVGSPLAESWDGASWTLQRTPAPKGGASNELLGVSCASSQSCAAVGFSSFNSLAEIRNGKSWIVTPTAEVPGGMSAELAGVSCGAVNACVAVGSYVDPTSLEPAPLINVWNGASWSAVIAPTPADSLASSLFGVSCTSNTRCTAVGRYSTESSQLPLIETWNGTSWKIRNAPIPSGSSFASLSAVSCLSTTACTAAGAYLDTEFAQLPLIEAWDGHSWHVQTAPVPKSSTAVSILGVSCASASACTVGGFYVDVTSAEKSLIEGWNGTRWTIEASPNPQGAAFTNLYGVSCTGIAGDCTAAGTYVNLSGSEVTLAEARTETGPWKIQPTPNPPQNLAAVLFGVSCTAPITCVATGAYFNADGNSVGLIEAES